MAEYFNELVQSVGLDELTDIDSQEIIDDFMPAAVTGLADGDIMVINPPYEGPKADFYGESHYSEGRVAQVIGKAAIENGFADTQLYGFQGFAADFFLEPRNLFADIKPSGAVRIFPRGLTINNNPITLPHAPSLVVDYAACLTGRSYTADQVDFVTYGRPVVDHLRTRQSHGPTSPTGYL
jgi:hypothetical protein